MFQVFNIHHNVQKTSKYEYQSQKRLLRNYSPNMLLW